MHSSPPLCRAALALGLVLLIQREPLARAAETASPKAAPRPASETASPSKPPAMVPVPLSVRFDLGLGGGSVGVAARVGAEFDLWLLPNLALSLMGAYGSQAALFHDSYHDWFFGPGLVVREHPEGDSMFASAAAGVALGDYTSSTGQILCGGACNASYSLSGFGAALSAGWMGRAGGAELGGSLKVDILYVDAGGQRTLATGTGNFIVGFSGP